MSAMGLEADFRARPEAGPFRRPWQVLTPASKVVGRNQPSNCALCDVAEGGPPAQSRRRVRPRRLPPDPLPAGFYPQSLVMRNGGLAARALARRALQMPTKIAKNAPTVLASMVVIRAMARISDGAIWPMKRIIPPTWRPGDARMRTFTESAKGGKRREQRTDGRSRAVRAN